MVSTEQDTEAKQQFLNPYECESFYSLLIKTFHLKTTALAK